MQAGGLQGLASLLATIHGLYPQARVTSGYRGPDNSLTLKNPSSQHAQGSPEDPHAVDVAPIPGVSFDQYVSSVKGAGVPVGQAFDEASHPFPWTTGPNWHIASGGSQVAARPKPRTLADIGKPDLAGQSPVDIDQSQLPSIMPMSLGDMAQGMPQGKIPNHTRLFKGNDLAAIAGILGDSLMAYGGLQPQFGPRMAQQDQDERAQAFDREKWNAQLQERREEALAKAQEPPQFIQNLQAYQAMAPEQQRQYLQYLDNTQPIAVSGPQGTQRVPRTMDSGNTKTVGGVTYYNVNGEWYDNPEGR